MSPERPRRHLSPEQIEHRRRARAEGVERRRQNRDPNLFTIRNAAEYLGIGESTFRRQLAKDSALKAALVIYVGHQMRISKIRLERYLHGDP